MTKLTWLSHATWLIEHGDLRILLDPFFTDNPAAHISADDMDGTTHILVSHGHFDHVGDVASIARRTGAVIVTNFEIAQWFDNQDVPQCSPMNVGGTIPLSVADQELGRVKMVPAIHSSGLPDGSYGGSAAGFVLTLGDNRIYFACDTAYFTDMKFYAHAVDVAVIPIGDVFTMGVDDSIQAIKLIEPKLALPTHHGTWPPITQDVKAWAARVKAETSSDARTFTVGQSVEL